jgi:hypothetical protein
VTPKEGDVVAVVTRSVESPEEVLEEASGAVTPEGESEAGSDAAEPAEDSAESPDVPSDATIDGGTSSDEVSPE